MKKITKEEKVKVVYEFDSQATSLYRNIYLSIRHDVKDGAKLPKKEKVTLKELIKDGVVNNKENMRNADELFNFISFLIYVDLEFGPFLLTKFEELKKPDAIKDIVYNKKTKDAVFKDIMENFCANNEFLKERLQEKPKEEAKPTENSIFVKGASKVFYSLVGAFRDYHIITWGVAPGIVTEAYYKATGGVVVSLILLCINLYWSKDLLSDLYINFRGAVLVFTLGLTSTFFTFSHLVVTWYLVYPLIDQYFFSPIFFNFLWKSKVTNKELFDAFERTLERIKNQPDSVKRSYREIIKKQLNKYQENNSNVIIPQNLKNLLDGR